MSFMGGALAAQTSKEVTPRPQLILQSQFRFTQGWEKFSSTVPLGPSLWKQKSLRFALICERY